MKTRIKNSWFEPETGMSYVELCTPQGLFYATAYCHPEDMESGKASRYLGCSIAETRCLIQSFKKQKKDLQMRLKEAETIYDALKDGHAKKAKSTVEKRIVYLRNKINNINANIDDLSSIIDLGIENYFEQYLKLKKK